MGITITDVKIYGSCSKHVENHVELLTQKDKYGNRYEDKDIFCIECNL